MDEAKALTQTNEIEEITKKLSKRIPLTAVKMGNNGCLIVTPTKKVQCPTKDAVCVDSTGAGDAFDSALIYSVINDFDIETMGNFANWYASYNVKKLGPRSFPKKAEINDYLSNVARKIKPAEKLTNFKSLLQNT